MKAKIKKGGKHLFSKGFSNKWTNIKYQMIINFINKNTYKSFIQKKNHLIINSTEGEIDVVFTGEVPKLKFCSYCKSQLILSVIK